MTYQFTFLRHGQSVSNPENPDQELQDFPLSPKGRDQSEHLAQKWSSQGWQFDTIFTSPSSCAQSTAQIIQSKLGAPLITDPVWEERHWGNQHGNFPTEINQSPLSLHSNRLYEPPGGNGESKWQLSLRAGTALQSLFKNPPGKYLIISHQAFIDKVLHAIFGIKVQPDFNGLNFYLANTASTTLKYHLERNQWQMCDFLQPDTTSNPPFADRKSYHFTFVRHAESQGNVEKIFQGQSETPLSAWGRKQAQDLGIQFAQSRRKFDYVYASPQIRAVQTAELICAPIEQSFKTSPLLKEINNGNFSGLRGEEIDVKFPSRPDRTNPYLPIGESGESWFELYLRGMQIVDFLFSHPPGKFMITSHGALLNALICCIVGIPPQPSRRSVIFRFENTGICECTFSPEQNLWHFLSLKPGNSQENLG